MIAFFKIAFFDSDNLLANWIKQFESYPFTLRQCKRNLCRSIKWVRIVLKKLKCIGSYCRPILNRSVYIFQLVRKPQAIIHIS